MSKELFVLVNVKYVKVSYTYLLQYVVMLQKFITNGTLSSAEQFRGTKHSKLFRIGFSIPAVFGEPVKFHSWVLGLGF